MAKTVTLGLMSGTSLDGVDAVAVDFSGVGPRLIGHHHIEFPKPLKEKLLALCQPGGNEIDRMGDASVELGKFYVYCINELLDVADIGRKDVAAVGIHGQTIRHRPEQGWTLQLNNPALVAELSGLDVVSDFRSRDIAAGGEGAPLVPAFHRQVFMGEVARSVVNIGGIANVTFLPPRRGYGKIIGFDCGPGNILLDAWCRKHIARPYDTNGAWGATGRVHDDLLAKLLSDPYFDRQPPKSTGREHFNLEWLESQLAEFGTLEPADVQATLVMLTARTITDAIKKFAGRTEEIYLCGGGALNGALAQCIRECAGDTIYVRSTSALGVDPMHVEAMAFAWLAWAFLQKKPGNLPEVTNASGARLLGALYPH